MTLLPSQNVCTVSIARETVYQTCDHGAQELKLMSRLEVSLLVYLASCGVDIGFHPV
jgi:hypothetical protein